MQVMIMQTKLQYLRIATRALPPMSLQHDDWWTTLMPGPGVLQMASNACSFLMATELITALALSDMQ